jgi:hypothetical protein
VIRCLDADSSDKSTEITLFRRSDPDRQRKTWIVANYIDVPLEISKVAEVLMRNESHR